MNKCVPFMVLHQYINQPVDLAPALESRHINMCVLFMPMSQHVNLLTCHVHQKVITVPTRFPTVLYLNKSTYQPVTCFRRLAHQENVLPSWYCFNISTCQPVNLLSASKGYHITQQIPYHSISQYVNLSTYHLFHNTDTSNVLPLWYCLKMSTCRPIICIHLI